ncbi:MAG TPA: hypothetical protein VID75_01665 [Acidimicrobiales bacterium]
MEMADRGTPTAPLAGAEPPAAGRSDEGVQSNARLTASTAAVLLVLLAAEGVTILKIHSLLSPHVFIGMLLVPPVLLKIGSTSYRFVRYYRGAPAYRRKGPPPILLRLLGPFVVASTAVVLASGIALMFMPRGPRQSVLLLHKATFVLWFGAMAIHVLGHLADTTRLAPRDWLSRTRRDVRGAGRRQWAVVASVALGVPLGILLLGRVGPWDAHQSPRATAEHGTSHRSAVPPPITTTTPATAGAQGRAPVPAFTVPSFHLGAAHTSPVPSGPSVSPPTSRPSRHPARHPVTAHRHRHGNKKPAHGA